MATLLRLANITYPLGNYGQAESCVFEDVSCSLINCESASYANIGFEESSCLRINMEAIGYNGVCTMPALFNSQPLRGVPFTQGVAGPKLQGRLATDPLTSGAKYGEPLQQADIDTITVTASIGVADESTGQITWTAITGYDDASVTVANAVSDTLLPWFNDAIGHNFYWTVPADMLDDAEAGNYAKVVFTITLESGVVLWQSFQGQILFR